MSNVVVGGGCEGVGDGVTSPLNLYIFCFMEKNTQGILFLLHRKKIHLRGVRSLAWWRGRVQFVLVEARPESVVVRGRGAYAPSGSVQ